MFEYNPYDIEKSKIVKAYATIDRELMLRLTAAGAVAYSSWVDFYAQLSGAGFLGMQKIKTNAQKIDKLFSKAEDDWCYFASSKGLSYAYGDICAERAYRDSLSDLLVELLGNYYYGTMKQWKLLSYLQMTVIVSGVASQIFLGLMDFVEKTYGIPLKKGYKCFNLGSISHSINALSKMILKYEEKNCKNPNLIIDNNSSEIKKAFREYAANVSNMRWLMECLHDASVMYGDKSYGYSEFK